MTAAEVGAVPDDVEFKPSTGDLFVRSIEPDVPLGYIDPRARAAVAEVFARDAKVREIVNGDFVAPRWMSTEARRGWRMDAALLGRAISEAEDGR